MADNYEFVQYPKVRHIRIFIDEIKYRSQHLHSDYELCFALKGKGRFYSLNRDLLVKEGEILFLDSNEPHSIHAEEEPFVGLFIQVSNRFLHSYLPEMNAKRYANANLSQSLGKEKCRELTQEGLLTALSYFRETEYYRLSSLRFVLELLQTVFEKIPGENLTSKEADSRRRNAERLQRITDYIDEHLQEKIAQTEIAGIENITTTHLSHLFATGLGINFQTYVNQRRLELAVRLMRNSSKGILEISYEAGFSDPKYMSRLFQKHFGCTPKQFRGQDFNYSVSAKSNSGLILEKIYDEEEAIHFAESLLQE